ncbi:hypothetical protein PTI97_12525 [Exiguobacterium marinum]|uniref:DUF3169 family protein n=1 Tax=Exiguobacterium marinum TaxID=273528 RepID=A0ABY7WXP1_9BACL|nr:hypothetical protein [Exiguobacterium marinum]WDH75641.1 hypothetical protein PTI97_12525 [Exiguobacterium marinum]
MKHVVVQSISSIILYVLMAFLFSSFLSDISTIIESDSFIVEFNLLPLLLLIGFFIVWTVYSFNTRPNKQLNFAQWSVRMTEFSEVDEREQIITAKATKAAYVSFSISVPLLMGSFMFYPLFEDALPTYPIYALASTLIIATFVYMVTWIRAYTR